jgi:crossover junction endodeoxyribonuclease RusA
MARLVTLDCFVPGHPRPKGSWKIYGKRLVPDNAGEKVWSQSIGWAAKVHRPELVKKPKTVTVRLIFCMPKPKSSRTGYPIGDVDKLTRSVLDALTGIAYTDDVQVTQVDASKRWADANLSSATATGPGVYVSVETEL